MKKIAFLLLSLALIVGCLFALSSCECEHEFDESKAETITDATCETDGESQNVCLICHETVSIAIPQLGHKWSTKRTVDAVATCVEDGSESTHCTRKSCTAKKDVTVLPMDPTAHGVENWTIDSQATAFANGSRNGYCPHCKQNIVETISNEDAISLVSSAHTDPWKYYEDYSDILGEGNHFYPTEENLDGNDLFIEFSLLWNQWAKQGADYIQLRLWGFKDTNNRTIMRINLKDEVGKYGIVAGTIEPKEMIDYTEDSPYKGKEGSTLYNKADATKSLPGFANYGWYRIGVQVHQDATIVNGEVKLSGVCTIYLNGEMVLKYNMRYEDEGEDAGLISKGGVLYKAAIDPNDNTKIVYEDNTDGFGPYIYIEYFANCPNFYLPIADVALSAGNEFVYKVEKLETAAASTSSYLVAEGKRVSAKQWFKYK